MIKFTATTPDKRKLLCVGLSHANLKRLKDDQPIRFKGEDVGLPDQDFLIFFGETEESLAAQIAPWITAETKTHG